MAFCLFTVDCESGVGAKRIRNEEIAELAYDNADIVIPFASIDPHKGKLGAIYDNSTADWLNSNETPMLRLLYV